MSSINNRRLQTPDSDQTDESISLKCTKCKVNRGLKKQIAELKKKNIEFKSRLLGCSSDPLDLSLKLVSYSQQLKNAQIDLEASKNEMEEERVCRIDLQNQLVKVNGEVRLLRANLESEERIDVEGQKRKLCVKLMKKDDRLEEVVAR